MQGSRRTRRPFALAARGTAARGFTLMELLIVLAIAVGLIAVMGASVQSMRKSNLRTAATQLTGAIKYTYDRAVATGKYYRLVIDLDAKRFYPEVSDDRFYLLRDRDRGRRPPEEEDESGGAGPPGAPAPAPAAPSSRGGLLGGLGSILGGGGGATGTGQAPKVGTGRPRFAAEQQSGRGPSGTAGGPAAGLKMSAPLQGVTIAGVWTPRQNEPITQGKAYLYFYPEGMGERAIIYLEDGSGATYSLVTHPLTGRVQVTDQKVDIPRGSDMDDEGQEQQ
jgi:general secretion pathway protein H